MGLKPRYWIGRWVRQTQGAAAMHQEMHDFGDFEDGAFEYEDGEEFGLFEAPQQIEEERVDFDFMPSKVEFYFLIFLISKFRLICIY